MEKYVNGQEMDLYCVDCQTWTRQKYRGIMPDHTYLFLCKECGCENQMEIDDDKTGD